LNLLSRGRDWRGKEAELRLAREADVTNPEHEALRESWVARQNASSERLQKHRKEIVMLLNENEKTVLREKRVTSWSWAYIVLLSTAFLVMGGMRHDTLLGLWFGILACFWFLFGSVFVVRQRMNHHELVMLEELKGIEGHLLEVQRRLELRASAR
jgi:hypothetical protein